MALIPPDAGIRMRMQTEAQIQPLAPVRGVPSDLPDLQPGQLFSARIQQVLPDNTYRALVAGKELTLALPHGAKPGDSLELVVMDRSARTVMAQLATPTELKPGVVFTALIQEALPENIYRALVGDKPVNLKLNVTAKEGERLELTVIDRSSRLVEAHVTGRAGTGSATEPYLFTRISPAAQFIGKLLVSEGQTPAPAPLNGGQPILAAPPQSGVELAPRLAQAVAQSGLFYEAHQAQWVAGKLPTEILLKEPQGQQQGPAVMPQKNPELLSSPMETRTQPAVTTPSGPATMEKIPEVLLPLVQQQLDAAATQRLLWHGEIWPEQPMEWEIQRDAPDQNAPDQESPGWTTRLSLTTPRLGRVEASLQLGTGGLRVTVTATDEASTDNLRKNSAALVSALDGAGVPLSNLLIRHGQ